MEDGASGLTFMRSGNGWVGGWGPEFERYVALVACILIKKVSPFLSLMEIRIFAPGGRGSRVVCALFELDHIQSLNECREKEDQSVQGEELH